MLNMMKQFFFFVRRLEPRIQGSFKGPVHDWASFQQFPFTPTFIQQQYKVTQNRDNQFKIDNIEKRATHYTRINGK